MKHIAPSQGLLARVREMNYEERAAVAVGGMSPADGYREVFGTLVGGIAERNKSLFRGDPIRVDGWRLEDVAPAKISLPTPDQFFDDGGLEGDKSLRPQDAGIPTTLKIDFNGDGTTTIRQRAADELNKSLNDKLDRIFMSSMADEEPELKCKWRQASPGIFQCRTCGARDEAECPNKKKPAPVTTDTVEEDFEYPYPPGYPYLF